MSRSDEIMGLLKDLRDEEDCIHACMVARQGLEGLIMFPEAFRDEVSRVWEPLSHCLNSMLVMVALYSDFELETVYSEILGYGIYMQVLDSSDTALILFLDGDTCFPKLNELRPSVMDTRDKILKVIG